jgi:hypothetical protein
LPPLIGETTDHHLGGQRAADPDQRSRCLHGGDHLIACHHRHRIVNTLVMAVFERTRDCILSAIGMKAGRMVMFFAESSLLAVAGSPWAW